MSPLDLLEKLGGRPIRRSSLCLLTGLSDRKLRAELARLSAAGYPVVHDESGGYYLATEPEDVERELAQNMARIRSLAERVTGQRKAVRALAGEDQGRLW